MNTKRTSTSYATHTLDDADRLLNILDTAHNHDLGGVRVPSAIASWIRLKLGDVLRLLVLHDQRHLIQAQRALDATTPKTVR